MVASGQKPVRLHLEHTSQCYPSFILVSCSKKTETALFGGLVLKIDFSRAVSFRVLKCIRRTLKVPLRTLKCMM